jgi:hypothetical protein
MAGKNEAVIKKKRRREMAQYEVIWGGDEEGIWRGDKQIVAAYELQRRRLTAYQVCQWSQKSIARLVSSIERSRRPGHD